MTLYVRQPGSDTWHYYRTCPAYPVAHDTIKRETRPTSGLLCPECRALESEKQLHPTRAGS